MILNLWIIGLNQKKIDYKKYINKWLENDEKEV